jgi:outer membrane protein assembly factor BamE (lipoprotein component of BamABCDE complex)
MNTKERDGCTLLFMAIILILMLLTSCTTWNKVLYGQDPCGNAWKMEKVHKAYPSLSH